MLKQENAHAWIRIARGSDQCHGCGPGNIWPVATRGIRDCEQWFPTIGGPVFDPPPLKWSDLRYVFDIKEDCNGKEAIQA